MTPFSILFIIIAIFAIVEFVQSSYSYSIFKWYYIALFIILLSLFSGFRIGIKPDYYNYEYIFCQVDNGFDFIKNNYFKIETGYIYLNELFVSLGFNFHSLLLFIAFTSVSLTLLSYQYFTKYIVLTTLIYFSFIYIIRDMGAIRAGLSYSILLFSLIFLVNDKKLYFVFFVFIASLFHGSAIVFFIVYPLFYIDVKYKYLYCLLIFSLIFNLLGLSSFFLDKISSFGGVSYFETKISDYTKESIYNYQIGLLDITNIKNMFFSLISIYFIQKGLIKQKIKITIITLFVLGTCIRISLSDFAAIAGRTGGVFTTVEPLVLVFLMESIRNYKTKVITFIFILIYCILMIFLGLYKYETYPYQSILG
ncbi:TPA: EpsG family protein [Photobacterium damselae]